MDEENDDAPTESLPCQHNMSKKGYLARNATNGKYIQRVYLNNLKPNRRYCYEITSGQASSHIYSFRTASLSVNIGIRDENYYHTNFLVYGSDIMPSTMTTNEPTSLNSLMNSFKNQMKSKQINAFLNLPMLHLKQLGDKDFFGYYTDVLSNLQILPTICQLGKFFNYLKQFE